MGSRLPDLPRKMMEAWVLVLIQAMVAWPLLVFSLGWGISALSQVLAFLWYRPDGRTRRQGSGDGSR
jgi:hypothetical protein